MHCRLLVVEQTAWAKQNVSEIQDIRQYAPDFYCLLKAEAVEELGFWLVFGAPFQ